MPVCLCPKGRKWVLFRLQVNEMNEKMSFKMGVKFAASFYLGKSYAMETSFFSVTRIVKYYATGQMCPPIDLSHHVLLSSLNT